MQRSHYRGKRLKFSNAIVLLHCPFRKYSYICAVIKRCLMYFLIRRDGRVVDYSGLENRRTERYRGFESLSLRNEGCKSASCAIYTLFYTRKYLSSQAYEMINWSSVKSSNGLPFFPQSLNTSSPHSRAIRWCLFRLYICSIVY